MGLEVATFVSQLVSSNPVVGDPVSQGDDHLRLVKSTLQSTFPNASKALYFPTSVAAQTGTVNVVASDAGKIFPVDASGAPRTVNLPATPPDGFEVTIVKVDDSANAVTIAPPGGTEINDEANITLISEFESARCIYMSTVGHWVATRSARGSPFDSFQEAAKVWPIANGGTGQDTAYEAFDALSPARVDVASAATVDLDAAQSSFVHITGTTTITGITLAAGRKRWVKFQGILTLTSSANLILPSQASIITATGDTALFISLGGGVVQCMWFARASGQPVLPFAPARGYAEYTTHTDITEVIPVDDTIPQVGEGREILSVGVTLRRSTSRVRVSFQAFGQYLNSDDTKPWAAALFLDGAANAIAASIAGANINDAATNHVTNCVLEFEHAPGSVGPFTYTIRVGPSDTNGAFGINGTDSGRLFGGTARATLVVEEIFV